MSLLLCGLVGLYSSDFFIKGKPLVVFDILFLMTIINYLFVGNATLKDAIYVGLFAFASLSLISDGLNEKILLIAFAMNAIAALIRIGVVGIYGPIYANGSRNFISVYILFPIVVYYGIIGRRGIQVRIMPALLCWIVCLVARGRGGILAATFLLVGVLLVKYKKLKPVTKLIITILLIIIVAVVIWNQPKVVEKVGATEAMELFAQNGMETSRLSFWPEYIDLATQNLRSLTLGADAHHTMIWREFEGNPHNTFMEMHMLTGSIGLGLVVFLCIRNSLKSLKMKNHLYLIGLITILMRAFTDHVLWASFGTPVLFYFLLYFDFAPTHR